jgi:hypothetical protein
VRLLADIDEPQPQRLAGAKRIVLGSMS